MAELLTNVWRGVLIESQHFGYVVITDRDGNITYALGDPHFVTYWRSAAKPFQAIPLMEQGGMEKYGLTSQEIALMCASHGGEAAHVQAACNILDKIGLLPSNLHCGPSLPLHQESAENLLMAQKVYNALHHNCSGKHAGMLALAQLTGVDPEGYYKTEHPVQQMMLEVISDCVGMPVDDIIIGVDGCGVPVYGLPLVNMAMAYARFAKPEGYTVAARADALRRVCRAMTAEAYYVAGTDRMDTELMTVTKGRIVAKVGAEGVYGLGIVDEGIGLALKVADGNLRSVGPVVISLLKKFGWITEAEFKQLQHWWRPPLKNSRDEVIGRIESAIAADD